MGKAQYLAIAGALVLFAVLYWGFGTKPPSSHKQGAMAAKTETKDVFERLLQEAKSSLKSEQSSAIAADETTLAQASDDNTRISAMKTLSSHWFEYGHLPVAAGYAEQVAELEKSDSAWSVAGALFFNSLIATQEPDIREYCASQAAKSFETAAALNPDQAEHQVNLALVYAENPPADNPMKAVLLLRDLEKKYPEDASVYNALGRLAIKTGQWERAIERLEKARSLDPKNTYTPCLLSRAYDGAGQADKAAEFAKLCK